MVKSTGCSSKGPGFESSLKGRDNPFQLGFKDSTLLMLTTLVFPGEEQRPMALMTKVYKTNKPIQDTDTQILSSNILLSLIWGTWFGVIKDPYAVLKQC